MIAFPDPPFIDGQIFTDPDSGREFRFDEALPGWRFVSDGAAPPALPPALPEVVLEAAGAGSSWGNPRVFLINADMAASGTGIYSLRSTDMTPIFYNLQFELTGLSAGTRKHILIDMRNLFRPTFIVPGGGGSERYSMANGSTIMENGEYARGWQGRENIISSDWNRMGEGLPAILAAGVGRWRRRISESDTRRVDSLRKINRWYDSWGEEARRRLEIVSGRSYTTWSPNEWGNFANPPRSPSRIRVIFEYYGPSQKLLTLETYYRLTERGT